MLFDSALFLFRFLPVFIIGCVAATLLAKHGWVKNSLMIIAGLTFCFFFDILSVVFVVAIFFICYIFGYLIQKSDKKGRRFLVLVLSLALVFVALVYYKYLPPLSNTLNLAFGISFGFAKDVVAPLGIVVLSFSAASYLIDVYKEKASTSVRFFDFSAFMSLGGYIFMFPSYIAGPILNYNGYKNKLAGFRKTDFSYFDKGVERFILGLAKKLLLADLVGGLWRKIVSAGGIGLANVSTPLAWLLVLSFVFQLYFELSGYSSMAIGLMNIAGFDVEENFNLPFCASSVADFFGRWNVSLTKWLRQYLFVPLTKSKGKIALFVSLLVCSALAALWYGASSPLLYGAVLVCLLVFLEKTFLKKFLQKHRVFSRVYTLVAMTMVFVFVVSGIGALPLSVLLPKLFIPQTGGVGALYFLMNFLVPLVLCLLCSTALPSFVFEKIREFKLLRAVILLALFVLAIVFMQGNASQNISFAQNLA